MKAVMVFTGLETDFVRQKIVAMFFQKFFL